MKRLHIGASSILTGDDLADAVLELATALYATGHVETIGLPFIDEGGEPQLATLHLTPALALWATTVTSGDPEPVDPDLVAFLQERSSLLLRSAEVMRTAYDPFDL